MSLRWVVLGFMGLVALSGASSGQPPRSPVVEGREPDPVVRQFHAVEPATFGYGVGGTCAAPAPRATRDVTLSGMAFDLLSDLLPNQFTMPLGTVPMWE